MQRVYWKSIVEDERAFHLAGTIKKKSRFKKHTHDFPEMFWIKSGSGFHGINGKRIPLVMGNIVFIRPNDSHAFDVEKNGEMELINLAFPLERLSFYQKNYFVKGISSPWLSVKKILPLMLLLSARQNIWLSKEFDLLSATSYSPLDLDAFMLNIFSRFTNSAEKKDDLIEECPAWLKTAILKIKRPGHIDKGTSEFVDFCHKSSEHVNRTIKSIYFCTTTELVNRIKVEYAKSKLQLTNDTILDISMSCGFNHLGHFYSTFKKVFSETPKECRLKAHSVI